MLASFLTWSSRIVCCAIGSEMTLLVSVSMRVFPSPERHMRDAVWVGFAPEADCVLLAHSEHEGGAGGGSGIFGGWPTAATSLPRGLNGPHASVLLI